MRQAFVIVHVGVSVLCDVTLIPIPVSSCFPFGQWVSVITRWRGLLVFAWDFSRLEWRFNSGFVVGWDSTGSIFDLLGSFPTLVAAVEFVTWLSKLILYIALFPYLLFLAIFHSVDYKLIFIPLYNMHLRCRSSLITRNMYVQSFLLKIINYYNLLCQAPNNNSLSRGRAFFYIID